MWLASFLNLMLDTIKMAKGVGNEANNLSLAQLSVPRIYRDVSNPKTKHCRVKSSNPKYTAGFFQTRPWSSSSLLAASTFCIQVTAASSPAANLSLEGNGEPWWLRTLEGSCKKGWHQQLGGDQGISLLRIMYVIKQKSMHGPYSTSDSWRPLSPLHLFNWTELT